MNKEEITRKEMFIGKFRSKLTYVFNSADLEDVESIIDFYEQKLSQLEWELDSRTNYYNDAKELYFKSRDKVEQLKKDKLRLAKKLNQLESTLNEVKEIIETKFLETELYGGELVCISVENYKKVKTILDKEGGSNE